ncbi:histidine kinase [uncultured Aquimarina sp.]|uniref:sensor histidine kinase n=1 Tax=uncultured Aquimarina sp. TaxID=575652 RepID=UPI00260C4138|nr:histidine kinase [uncultured Aquimarina sp.]
MKSPKSIIDNVIQNRVISHLLFWSFFLMIFVIIASLNSGEIKTQAIIYFSLLPSQMIAAYILNYYQIPKLLLKKNCLLFIASMILCVYMFSALGRLSVVYIAEPLIRENFTQESIVEIMSDTANLFSIYFPTVYIHAFIMLIVKLIKNRFEEKHQIEILEKEKATSELKFLKTQIQPHFLFNTLNNLYALTLIKSDLAPEIVLKLSGLLDFILYQSNESTISIHKEIELLQGFIDLESLRYGDKLDLVFENNIDNANTQIAPLMLLPIIENAFKHGSSGNPDNARIRIKLSVVNLELDFEVHNTKPKIHLLDVDHNKSGIGTINLKRQLELTYPNKNRLKVDNSLDSYSVKLYLDLK